MSVLKPLLPTLLVLVVWVAVLVHQRTCKVCKKFGLSKDTRRYLAGDHEVLDTIVFCSSCGKVNEHYVHVVSESEPEVPQDNQKS